MNNIDQPTHLENIEKPPFLYHGTIDQNIKQFEPRSAKERPKENPAVYASDDIEIAVQSMANKYVSNGGVVDGIKFVCIPMGREEFIRQDRGGVVYRLPSESFAINKGIGLGDKEWVSHDEVKPIDAVIYPSLLRALLDQGTQVYFIEPELIEVINRAQDENQPDTLKNILKNLTPEDSDR